MTTTAPRRRSRPWGLLCAVLLAYLLPLLLVVLTPAAIAVSSEAGDDTFVVMIATLSVIASSVGAVIRWRRPGNRVGGLLMAGAIMVVSAALTWPVQILLDPKPNGEIGLPLLLLLWWGANGILFGVLVLFPGVAILFPDGHLPGPRFRAPVTLAVGLIAVATACATLAPARTTENSSFPWPGLAGVPYQVGDVGTVLSILAIVLSFGLAIASVVVRFRRSQGVERAQMKWLIASVTLVGILFPISWVRPTGPADLITIASVVAGCLVPIAIGIAILRYHLYDIDRIVSRTVGWTLVTALLAAVFVGLIVALETLLAPATSGSTLAVAASTLAAATLFQPVRRRVQRLVDRRFDRARVDRERTAELFGERLRDEVAMAALTSGLQETVAGTLRPASQGLWLRRAR